MHNSNNNLTAHYFQRIQNGSTHMLYIPAEQFIYHGIMYNAKDYVRQHSTLVTVTVACWAPLLMDTVPSACYYSVQNLWSSSLLSKKLKTKIYRTTILPVVLHGCENWSLSLREESRLRVFENRVLRRVFGPKKDEVTGEWRKLHNEELNDLYSLPNLI